MTQLVPLSVTAPGFLGLNTQSKGIVQNFGWATKALNCIIDSAGRIASRKGWNALNTVIATSPNVQTLFEQVLSSGTETVISAANNVLYRGTTSLTVITGTAGDETGISADHWQMQNFNDQVVGFQAAHDPIVRTTGNFSLLQQNITDWTNAFAYVVGDVVKALSQANPTLYFHCTTAGTSGGSEPTWDTDVGDTTTDNTVTWTTRKMPNGNICHSAFGRIWVDSDGDASIMEFSDTLLSHKFRGGAAGTLDFKTVWSGDTLTAISSFEDLLIIFGQKTILVYSGPEDPATMALAEKIEGVGCIARDAVQNTGDDIVFLSNSGVRKLSRALQASGREPLGDLSKNVRDEFMDFVDDETFADIKSVYHEREGLYAVSLPGENRVFVFDLKFPTPDETARVTVWDAITPHSWLARRNRTLIVGQPGFLGNYTGFQDNAAQYSLDYESAWVDFSGAIEKVPVGSLLKILKDWRTTVICGAQYVLQHKWAYDYLEVFESESVNIPAGFTDAEYNVAEYNIGEYGGGDLISFLRVHPTSSGTVVKVGFSTTIDGAEISFQKIDLLSKIGKMAA